MLKTMYIKLLLLVIVANHKHQGFQENNITILL